MIKIITAYNLIQVIVGFFVISPYIGNTTILITFIIQVLFVIIANHFLLKRKMWAWYALLFWYIITTFNITTESFSWEGGLGFYIYNTISMGFGHLWMNIKLNSAVLPILIIHIISKRSFKKFKNLTPDTENLQKEQNVESFEVVKNEQEENK